MPAKKETYALEINLKSRAADRLKVKIDQLTYSLRHPDELSMAQNAQFVQVLGYLQTADDAGRDMSVEIGSQVDAAVRSAARLIMVDLPKEVNEMLTFKDQVSIVRVFADQYPQPAPDDDAAETEDTPLVIPNPAMSD